MPPPPPPPPPPPGMGGPPPPPPMANLPARPPGNRGALLGDITKGKQLKKAVTNDRSAPIVAGTTSGGPGPSPLAGAPAVPRGLAPPVPSGNRARSNSDQSGRDSGVIEQPPQLGGLFAGGIPKLKKRGGGIDTGANQESSYASDPESSRSSAPTAPATTAPKPPTGLPSRPSPQLPAGTAPVVPSIANLRNNLNPMRRPNSSASLKGPPPPIGKKPPAPPGSRKPSFPVSQTSSTPSIPAPSAPPPPPTNSAPPLPGGLPPSVPRPPPLAAPSIRSQAPGPPPPPPPPPQSNAPTTNGGSQSLAVQAAVRAAAQASPSAAPPPPPPPPSHTNSYKAPALPSSPPPPPSQSQSYSLPSPPPAAPPPPISRAPTVQAPIRSMLDPSSYTLSSNGQSRGSLPNRNSQQSSTRVVINDPRWKFQDESMLPKPRDFTGSTKRYRAGRGSSVPIDLSAYE